MAKATNIEVEGLRNELQQLRQELQTIQRSSNQTINIKNRNMVIGSNISNPTPVYNTPYPYPYPPNQMIYSNPNVQNTPQLINRIIDKYR